MQAEILTALESGDLAESIARVEKLVAQMERPTALALGINLALLMANEMRTGKELGADSAALVGQWVEQWGEATVESAVDLARSFLLNPHEIFAQIKERMTAERG